MKKLFYLLFFVTTLSTPKQTPIVPFQAEALENRIEHNDVSGVIRILPQFASQLESVRTTFIDQSDALLEKPLRRFTFEERVKLFEYPLELRQNIVNDYWESRQPDVEDRLINKMLRDPFMINHSLHLFTANLEEDEQKALEQHLSALSAAH
ncbi:hypothetical protein HOM50_00605 [bacterium]|nr:hypothetical protein [bacterium]MBT5014891.1 hypothetical protein [bacterium]